MPLNPPGKEAVALPNFPVLGLVGSKGVIESNDPNKTCWTTGNFASTSALYIFISPWLIFVQLWVPLMFHNWFECSWKGPVFTFKMYCIEPRNKYSGANRLTVSGSVKLDGSMMGFPTTINDYKNLILYLLQVFSTKVIGKKAVLSRRSRWMIEV